MAKSEIDMTKGSILKNILLYAIPLMLTNALQLFYNAADTMVVGRWAGKNCLAAVGSTGMLTSLLVSIFIGLATGVTIVMSRKYGAGDSDGMNRASHTGVMLGIVSGIGVMIIGFIICRPMLEFLNTPHEIIDLSLLYVRIIFVGVPAQMVYNFGSAILRSVGDTKRPLYIVLCTGLVNVLLNLLLVIVFHMGVAGVAIATVVSHYLSALAVMYILTKSDAVYRISLKSLRFHKAELKDMISIGLPGGLQSSVFALGNMAIGSAVNSFGTAVIAGRSAGSNIEAFVQKSMDALYHTVTTAVAQNYGAKNEKRIKKSIWVAVACSVTTGFVLGYSLFFLGKPLLGLFIVDSPEAMQAGLVYMGVVGLTLFLNGIMDITTGALRGLGYAKGPALCSLIGACGFRVLWTILILPLNKTPWFLYLCQPISWIIVSIVQGTLLLCVWKSAMKKMRAQQ